MSMTMTAAPPEPRLSGARRRLLFGAMCVGIFLVLLDVTALNVAVPTLGAGLSTDAATLAWVVDGYAVPFAALLLVGGTVGDLVGHRRVVLAGLAVFGLGSVGCALAPTAGVLIAARAVQGVGAALLLPGTLAEITRAYPDPAERGRAIGLWAAIGALAAPGGMVAGGLLVQSAGWRSVFWLNVPLVAVAMVVTALVAPAGHGARTRRPDVPGSLLAVVALGAFVFAAAGKTAWPVPLGVAALVGFVLVERRSADPMLPLGLFRHREFGLANAAAFVMNAGTLGTLFILSQFLQHAQHRPAALAGLAAMPAFLPLALLGPTAGRLVAQYGSRAGIVAGAGTCAVGLAVLGTSGPATPYPVIGAAALVWGLGLTALTPSVVSGAVNAVPDDRAGLASAVSNTARQTGGALGVASCAAVAGTADGPGFAGGFRVAVLCCAAVFALSATVTAVWYPRRAAA